MSLTKNRPFFSLQRGILKRKLRLFDLTLTKRGGYQPPLWIFFSVSPKQKRKLPEQSRWSIRHPLRSFWWKTNLGSTLPGARVSRQRPVDTGWLPPEEILNCHFEVACVVLKLTVYVKNVISFFYKLKHGEISKFGTFWQNFQLWPMFY